MHSPSCCVFPTQSQELEALLKSAHRPNYTCQVTPLPC